VGGREVVPRWVMMSDAWDEIGAGELEAVSIDAQPWIQGSRTFEQDSHVSKRPIFPGEH
jgi:hypothetical protein